MGASFIPLSGSWRWYNNTYGSGSWQDQETNISGIQNGDKFVIAYCAHDTGGKAANNQRVYLEFSTSATFSGGGTILGAQGTTDQPFRMVNDPNLTDQDIITTYETARLSCTSEAGTVHETLDDVPYEDFSASSHHEMWFTFEAYNVSASTTYYFRLNIDNVSLTMDAEITSYANLTTGAAAPTPVNKNLSSVHNLFNDIKLLTTLIYTFVYTIERILIIRSYKIKNIINSNLVSKWKLKKYIDTLLSFIYDFITIESVYKIISLIYSTYNDIIKTIDIKSSINNLVVRLLSSIWNIIKYLNKILTSISSVLVTSLNTVNIKYSIHNVIEKLLLSVYKIKEYSSKTLASIGSNMVISLKRIYAYYSLNKIISKLTSLIYTIVVGIGGTVSKTLNSIHRIANSVMSNFTENENILFIVEWVNKLLNSIHSLFTYINKQVSMKWKIKEFISKQLNVLYDILSPAIIKILGIGYSVKNTVYNSLISVYSTFINTLKVTSYNYILKNLLFRQVNVIHSLNALVSKYLTTPRLVNYNDDIVGSTNTNVATGNTFQRKCFYHNNRYWLFYYNGTEIVYTSSTDGNNWESETSVGLVDIGYGFAFSCFFDGSYVHYVRSYNYDLFYRRGTPNANGSISWSTEQTAYDGVSGNFFLYPSITVNSDGYACIGALKIESPNNYPYVIKNDNNDGTWLTSSGFPHKLNNSSSNTWRVLPVALADNKMYIIYGRYSPNVLQGILYDSEWGNEESNFTSANQGAGEWSAVANGNDVYLVYLATGSTIKYNKRIYNDGWKTEITLVSGSPYVNVNASPTLTKGYNNSLYCLWGNDTTEYVYYKMYFNNKWDTSITTLINETTDTITAGYSLTSFYSVYDNKVGLLYQTGPSATSNIKFFNSITNYLYKLRNISQKTITLLVSKLFNNISRSLSSIYSSIAKSFNRLSIKHGINVYIDKSLGFIYKIRNMILTILSSIWSSRSYVSKTIKMLYDVISTGIISSILNTTHSLSIFVSSSSVIIHKVRNSVTKTISNIYSVLASISKDILLLFSTNTIIAKISNIVYSLRNYIYKTITSEYNLIAKIYRVLSFIYEIISIGMISSVLTISHSLIGNVNKLLSSLWSSLNNVIVSMSTRWNIRGLVSKSLSAVYKLIKIIQLKLTVIYTVITIGFVEISLVISHSLKSLIDKLSTIKYDLLNYVSKLASIPYNIIAIINKLLSFVSKTLNNISNSLGFHFDVRNIVNRILSTSFSVITYIYSLLSSIYSIISIILKAVYEIILNPTEVVTILRKRALNINMKSTSLILKHNIRKIESKLKEYRKYIKGKIERE